MAGTIGHKLMSGKPTKIDLDKKTQIDVRCQVHIHPLPLLIYFQQFFHHLMKFFFSIFHFISFHILQYAQVFLLLFSFKAQVGISG